MKNSNITWTDLPFNPWSGCSETNVCAEECYADFDLSTKPPTNKRSSGHYLQQKKAHIGKMREKPATAMAVKIFKSGPEEDPKATNPHPSGSKRMRSTEEP